ncbi:uncharacterized protein LOC116805857 isoform X2 [Drosophila grimshawi]|uniref:uncharacterized protein LOC116805857 isoform X2 n=1 Tax=Drosophila grimshawi TaxID=7222 RepID=UPI001C9322F5|nr:uncharacterized protein LOC116805857 isoform X2 [Drosophila grimshawi]
MKGKLRELGYRRSSVQRNIRIKRNLKYKIFLREVLSKLHPIEKYYDSSELKCALETQKDAEKLCADFSKALKGDLNLEEITSQYSAAIMLLLLSDPETQNQHLELLNDCFNYTDMLKPTMIDYATRELLENFKFSASLIENHTDYDYMLYLLWAIPHIITASETGKMISLGLLRAFISELTKASPIIMHIYRNRSGKC